MIVFKHEMMDAIEKAMKDTRIAFEKACDDSFNNVVSKLKPYEPVPERGRLLTDADKVAYNAKVSAFQKEAEDKMHGYFDTVHKTSVNAPTEEELRAIQTFALMNTDAFSPEDYAERVDDMMNRFGSSPLAYETLRSMAIGKGIHDFKKHPVIEQRDAMKVIESNVHEFFESAKSFGNKDHDLANGGHAALAMAMIKEAAGHMDD